MIKTFDDIDCAPKGESFTKTEFYSSLRNKIINNEDYENVKDFWWRMCLKNLMRKFPYNPRKRTLDSSLSGCIHRYLSRAIIALPTQAKIAELFEKPLIIGFSCGNTRMAFDSIILLPENLQAQYKDNFKTIYKIENEGKKNIFED